MAAGSLGLTVDWTRPLRAPRGRNRSPEPRRGTRPRPCHLRRGRGVGPSRVPAQPPSPARHGAQQPVRPAPPTAAPRPAAKARGQGSRARQRLGAQRSRAQEAAPSGNLARASWLDWERGQRTGDTQRGQFGGYTSGGGCGLKDRKRRGGAVGLPEVRASPAWQLSESLGLTAAPERQTGAQQGLGPRGS